MRRTNFMDFNVKAYYRNKKIAENYDRERFQGILGKLFNYLEKNAIGRCLNYISDVSNGTALDAACGTGRITEHLLKNGLSIIGIDISKEMLLVAKDRTKSFENKVSFINTDVSTMGFSDKTFPIVICARFLHHIKPEERIRMLLELSRVSEKWIIISCAYSTLILRLRRKLKKMLGCQAPVKYPYMKQTLSEDLKRAGFYEVKRYWVCKFLSEGLVILAKRY